MSVEIEQFLPGNNLSDLPSQMVEDEPGGTQMSDREEGECDEDEKNIKIRDTLVTPILYKPPPNALVEKRIFTKVGQSKIVLASPVSLHFAGYTVGKTVKKKLRLTNVSPDVQRWNIVPPTTRHFRINYSAAMPERLVPGLFMDIQVTFEPDEWKYYYDSIRVHCQGEENLVVPLHAYPIMSTEEFPSTVKLPVTPIGEMTTFRVPLKCSAPIDFEFQLSVLEKHPSFTIHPMSGIVPALGETYVSVSYCPTDFCTAVMRLQLVISQFNSRPLVCTFVGSCLPGHHKFLKEHELFMRGVSDQLTLEQKKSRVSSASTVKVIGPVGPDTEFELLDPNNLRVTTNLSRKGAPRKEARFVSREKSSCSSKKEVVYRNHRFPLNLHNPHAVSRVLNQKEGKLRIKDLKLAMEELKLSGRGSRQMKEALFEQAVRQDVLEERANKLRWQVQLGSDPVTDQDRQAVIDDRLMAADVYKYETRGESLPEDEYRRREIDYDTRRVYRQASSCALALATFDMYNNNPYLQRFYAKEKFIEAAKTVILRCRAAKRLPLLRQMIKDYRAGVIGKPKSVSFLDEPDISELKECPLKMDSMKIKKFAFPVYESPGYKDDMAPDALGYVPVKTNRITITREIPFFELKVPQYYKLMGYTHFDVQTTRHGYVPTGLPRPLRTGAKDEIVSLPLPQDLVEELKKVDIKEFDIEEKPVTIQPPVMRLEPPPGLTAPVKYHPLHIFNPTPGLQTFYQPLSYSEIDPDFRLCPVPRYVVKDTCGNPYLSLQKKYIDEEDVIKGTMSWKKFPSQGLVSVASAPTLSQIYTPRWSDPFVSDILPMDGPQLLTELSNEDGDIIDSEHSYNEASEIVTPENVKKEWKLTVPTFSEKDDILTQNKLPASSHNPTSIGQPSRSYREAQLENFLAQKNLKLGTKVKERLNKFHSLLGNSDIVLK